MSKTPFTMEEISLYGAGGKPSWFLKLNPAGTVPVLDVNDGAEVIPDSELILEYVSNGENEMTRRYDVLQFTASLPILYLWQEQEASLEDSWVAPCHPSA